MLAFLLIALVIPAYFQNSAELSKLAECGNSGYECSRQNSLCISIMFMNYNQPMNPIEKNKL